MATTIEDTNLFVTTDHSASVNVSMSTDLTFAGCTVAVAAPELAPGYSLFRYRDGSWQWDVSGGAGETWMSADSWGGGFSAMLTDVSYVDEDFGFVELNIAPAWSGPDVAFNWPALSTELEDVSQRIMRGYYAAQIGGSKLPCIDVIDLLGSQVSAVLKNTLERVVAEMDEIESHTLTQVGTTIVISFVLYSGAEGSIGVELNNEIF